MTEFNLYRPEWTCGRYDAKSHSAILYNLIEGTVYSFIDYSADVIGCILGAGRNGLVNLNDIASKTGIAIESIQNFIIELVNANLVTQYLPTEQDTRNYRTQASQWKISNAQNIQETTVEKLPMDIANAEMEYTERVGGITSVMFELTYRCSEQCIHCYNIGATRNDLEISHRGSLKELTLDDYKRIIDELYEEGLVKVCLSGGDPFSYKYVWDIIDYLYTREIAFDVFTNGLAIRNRVQRLADYYPRLVGVSLYSGNSSEHDAITRTSGSWQKSLEVIRDLSALSVPMNIKCPVMKTNLEHYYQVTDIAKEFGAMAQIEISLSDSIEGDKCVSKYLRLSPEQLEVVLRDDNIPLYVGKEAPNYGGQKKDMSKNPCGAADNSFCVTPNGDLIPCCAFHLIFGNLKQQSVRQILATSKTLDQWRNATLCDYTECGRYDYCDYCNLCPGNNYSQHNDYLKAGENNCYVAKVRYALAKKMQAGYEPLVGMSLPQRLCEIVDNETIHIKREFNNKGL